MSKELFSSKVLERLMVVQCLQLQIPQKQFELNAHDPLEASGV